VVIQALELSNSKAFWITALDLIEQKTWIWIWHYQKHSQDMLSALRCLVTRMLPLVTQPELFPCPPKQTLTEKALGEDSRPVT
jgi:hypothetical protein